MVLLVGTTAATKKQKLFQYGYRGILQMYAHHNTKSGKPDGPDAYYIIYIYILFICVFTTNCTYLPPSSWKVWQKADFDFDLGRHQRLSESRRTMKQYDTVESDTDIFSWNSLELLRTLQLQNVHVSGKPWGFPTVCKGQ